MQDSRDELQAHHKPKCKALPLFDDDDDCGSRVLQLIVTFRVLQLIVTLHSSVCNLMYRQ